MRYHSGAVVTILALLSLASGAATAQKGPRVFGPAHQLPGTAGNADDSGPAVVFATTTLECGNKAYEVSTGTKTGTCYKVTFKVEGGNVEGVVCEEQGDDDPKYVSQAYCQQGCGPSYGAATCSVKSLD